MNVAYFENMTRDVNRGTEIRVASYTDGALGVSAEVPVKVKISSVGQDILFTQVENNDSTKLTIKSFRDFVAKKMLSGSSNILFADSSFSTYRFIGLQYAKNFVVLYLI